MRRMLEINPLEQVIVVGLQSRAVLSDEAVSTRRPSGLKTALST